MKSALLALSLLTAMSGNYPAMAGQVLRPTRGVGSLAAMVHAPGALPPTALPALPPRTALPHPTALSRAEMATTQAALLDTESQSGAQQQGSAGDTGRLAAFAKTFDGAAAGKAPKGVSTDWVQSMMEKDRQLAPSNRRLRDVVARLGFAATTLNRAVLDDHNENYTVELSRGPITNQKQSGRCWLFAGLNMVRSMMLADKKTPKDLEFSENYLHFFNMLEKSNSYLEEVAEKLYKRHAKSEKFGARKRRMTVVPNIGDGGWYQYFSFLVSKYGMLPKAAMGETISSEATAVLLKELDGSLASTAAQMMANAKLYKARKAANQAQAIKERGMARVWKILSTHLGSPPERFDYRENEKPVTAKGITTTPTRLTSMTPKEFAENVAKFHPDDYVSVASYPRKRADTVYQINKSAIGAAKPGEPTFDIRFMNVTSERLEELAVAAINGGQPVWFAADIGQDVNYKTGIMHPDIFDRNPVYQFSPDEAVAELSRAEQSYFRQISANHAMLLTGYDRPRANGPIVKFKVENSWGEDTGAKGIYHLYHKWFLQNVFEVVVHRKFLNEAEQTLWAGKAKTTKDTD